MNENIKDLIKNEYENGASINSLAKKYNQKTGTIKSWISRENWKKKEKNATTCNQLQPLKKDTKTQIKSDILNNATSEEILQNFAVSERTYYNYKKSVRAIQIEHNEKILSNIAETKYKDIEERLKNIADKKYELEIELLQTGIYETEKLLLIEKNLKLLKEFEKDIKTNARVIGDYRQAELEQQLVNEEIQKERLEIEKAKHRFEEEEIKINVVGV